MGRGLANVLSYEKNPQGGAKLSSKKILSSLKKEISDKFSVKQKTFIVIKKKKLI